MGARITKNVTAEYGEYISGKQYKLVKDIWIYPNTGHKFRHDQFYTSQYKYRDGIAVPEGSVVNVREVYIGTNLPDGGDFITITANIGEYEGIIVNELFSPQHPAIKPDIKFKPNPEYKKGVGGHGDWNTIPETWRGVVDPVLAAIPVEFHFMMEDFDGPELSVSWSSGGDFFYEHKDANQLQLTLGVFADQGGSETTFLLPDDSASACEHLQQLNIPVDKDTILLPNEDINTLRMYVRSLMMLEKFAEHRPQSIEECNSIKLESVEELTEWDCHLFLQAAYVKMSALEIIDDGCLDKTKWRIDTN